MQLTLFPDLVIVPTIAMDRGESIVSQCSMCGTLVCIPSGAQNVLGPCPSCGSLRWTRQELGVGPFHRLGPRKMPVHCPKCLLEWSTETKHSWWLTRDFCYSCLPETPPTDAATWAAWRGKGQR